MRTTLSTLVAICLIAASDAAAQLRLPRTPHVDGYTMTANASDPVQPAPQQPGSEEQAPRPTAQQLRLRNTLAIGGTALLVAVYGFTNWWQGGLTGPFGVKDEGWFGQDTQYGGADKLGHAFFSYMGMRLGTRGLEALGNDADSARNLSAWSTIAIMVAVEVLDGYSTRYNFSKEDVIMDIAGVALGYLSERNREFDNLFDFRLLYKPSESGKFEPIGDYSGQTYLVVAKASGVPALRTHSVLRYFELAVGYGARGYEKDTVPVSERHRNVYFGISLNLSEVLGQTVFRGAKERSGAQRATDMFFEFIQVPGTAALADHRL